MGLGAYLLFVGFMEFLDRSGIKKIFGVRFLMTAGKFPFKMLITHYIITFVILSALLGVNNSFDAITTTIFTMMTITACYLIATKNIFKTFKNTKSKIMPKR